MILERGKISYNGIEIFSLSLQWRILSSWKRVDQRTLGETVETRSSIFNTPSCNLSGDISCVYSKIGQENIRTSNQRTSTYKDWVSSPVVVILPSVSTFFGTQREGVWRRPIVTSIIRLFLVLSPSVPGPPNGAGNFSTGKDTTFTDTFGRSPPVLQVFSSLTNIRQGSSLLPFISTIDDFCDHGVTGSWTSCRSLCGQHSTTISSCPRTSVGVWPVSCSDGRRVWDMWVGLLSVNRHSMWVFFFTKRRNGSSLGCELPVTIISLSLDVSSLKILFLCTLTLPLLGPSTLTTTRPKVRASRLFTTPFPIYRPRPRRSGHFLGPSIWTCVSKPKEEGNYKNGQMDKPCSFFLCKKTQTL